MENYNNLKSSKIKRAIKLLFLSKPLRKTKESNEKVLDLGCGWGFYFKINPRAHGIDCDKDCISFLQKSGYKAILGDITKQLPFEDNYFKWIIAHDVFEHFELSDVKNIFKEVARILEPGGKVLILSPNKKGYDLGIKMMVGHKHFITRGEIAKIGSQGFIEETHYFYPFPNPIGDLFSHNKEVIILKKISQNE